MEFVTVNPYFKVRQKGNLRSMPNDGASKCPNTRMETYCFCSRKVIGNHESNSWPWGKFVDNAIIFIDKELPRMSR